MTTLNGVKMEDAPLIKPDPEISSPTTVMDEDQYEDTGELQLFDPNDVTSGVWLTKIPKYLWEAWSTMEDDEQIQIGKLRVWGSTEPGKEKMKIILEPNLPGHAKVPKEYDLKINNLSYNNACVFSEKNQTGYKAGMMNRPRPDVRPNQYRVNKRRYGSSIPKQTALVGYAKHELTSTAVENEEYHRLMEERTAAMFKPKHTTTYTTEIQQALHPGIAAGSSFESFVRKTNTSRKLGRAQEDKAIRMPQNELLDRLQAMFKRYRYWSMKAMRQELHQPEAYIKSTMEKIGTLVRSGPFAMQWMLNAEYQESTYAGLDVKEEAAEEQEDSDVDPKDEVDDDDEDESLKMEDVL
ncbi:transcription initiation factor IIF, beta subunit family protein [Cryomyces antarcticus]